MRVFVRSDICLQSVLAIHNLCYQTYQEAFPFQSQHEPLSTLDYVSSLARSVPDRDLLSICESLDDLRKQRQKAFGQLTIRVDI